MKEELKKIPGAVREVIDWSTDGCSAAPDLNFTECCEDHDFAYRNGLIPRRYADKHLRECMRDRGWKVLPWIYWVAVRAFGWRAYNWTAAAERIVSVGTKHQAWAALIDADAAQRALSGKSRITSLVIWVIKRILSAAKLA